MIQPKLKLWLKHLLFSCIPLICLTLCAELVLRTVYYQKQSAHSFALGQAVSGIQDYIFGLKVKRQIAQTFSEMGSPDVAIYSATTDISKGFHWKLSEALFTSQAGKLLLKKFQDAYEQEFITLVQEVNAARSKLIVLYIPSASDKSDPALKECRAFYAELTKRHQVEFLDLTDDWYAWPIEYSTFLPENGHLSRFGMQRIAEALSMYLDRHNSYKSDKTYARRPVLLGDCAPNLDEIWTMIPEMPFRVKTTKQGLRHPHDITFPKQKQRILVLGDSFTFGPHLPDGHCFTQLMNKKCPEREVINAGKMGYTITDELSLFMERAKFLEPDITVLQVLDNDLFGMFFFMKNSFDRKGRHYQPSAEELSFIETVRQSHP